MTPSHPRPDSLPPLWLWRLARLALLALLAGIAALAWAVAGGAADPRPVGVLRWEDHFGGAVAWRTFGQGAALAGGALTLQPPLGGLGGAVTGPAVADYSFEAAGGQSEGPVGAAYGIVFDYQSPERYIAVLLNGNGYVQVVGADGREYLAWQEWPNILLEYEANRVRVDVQAGQALIRVNDEVLLRLPAAGGWVGVLARASAPGQTVRFGWAKYWSQ